MAEKTERPTAKKIRDAARKGQTFKSKDIATFVTLAAGAISVAWVVDLTRLKMEFARMASLAVQPDAGEYIFGWEMLFLRIAIPFVVICAFTGMLPSLVQSRFTLALEAIRFDLTAVDPVKGIHRLLSWRSVKDALKALLYVIAFLVAVRAFAAIHHGDVFGLFRARPDLLGHMGVVLTVRLVLLSLLCALPVIVIDTVVEYFLHYKEMKMEKSEVTKENKDNEGDRKLKAKRREIHQELLSNEIKENIEQSNFILANPTHIAIGIYLNPGIVPIPFLSVRETSGRAIAAIRHAEASGVPVVRNVSLARSIYRNCPRRYSFVNHEDVDAVLAVLIWLKQVEIAHLRDHETSYQAGAALSRESTQVSTSNPTDGSGPFHPENS